MYKSSANIIVVVFLFAISPTRADNHPLLNDENPIQESQLSINLNAAEKYREADKKMNHLYTEKMSAMTTSKNKNRLRDAQRAWIIFRDKSCVYEAGLREENGSIWLMDYAFCMSAHTEKRIEDLKQYLMCIPEECQN